MNLIVLCSCAGSLTLPTSMSTSSKAPANGELNLSIIYKISYPAEPYPATQLVKEVIRAFLKKNAPEGLDDIDDFQLIDLGNDAKALDPEKTLLRNGVSDSSTLLLSKEKRHRETAKDKWVAAGLATYTSTIFLICTTGLVAIWPSTSAQLSLNSTRSITLPITLLGARVSLGPETLLVITMILSGVVGACVFSLYVISLHLGYSKDFDDAYAAWYLLRAPIGAGLALITYVIIRGGVFTVGAGLQDVNFLGVTAISFIVGLFTEHVMVKLHAIADQTFGSAPEDAPSGSGGTATKPS